MKVLSFQCSINHLLCLDSRREESCICSGYHHFFIQSFVQIILKDSDFFLFFIIGNICHSSYPASSNLYFNDWSKKRQLPNTANGCHSSLNRGEADTDINSLPHYTLLFTCIHPYSSFVSPIASFSAFLLLFHLQKLNKNVLLKSGTIDLCYIFEGSAQYVYCLGNHLFLTCESPRSQLYYSQLYYSQPSFGMCLIERNRNGWLGWMAALTKCQFCCAHNSHTWLCHVVPAFVLYLHAICRTFSAPCLHCMQLWSCVVWLNIGPVDLALNLCSSAASVPMLSFRLTFFSHW